jgi:AcrR family transcriptional regulator
MADAQAHQAEALETRAPLRGRQAEAARNDTAILEAARAVFLRDSSAPMSAVAERAGVGVAGLYRRFAGKDELLRSLCGDGLRQFVALAEEARADPGDPWAALERFLTAVVDSDVHSLTVQLAGTFRSTDELRQLAAHSAVVVEEVVRRAQESGQLRSDVSAEDLPMIFEQLSAVRVEDPARTAVLRRRYLALHLDALRHPGKGLAEPAPTSAELGERWSRSH